MGTDYRPEPTVFVIFGGAGDLSWRKLIPALHNLYLDNWLPEKFLVIGTGHRHTSDEDFRRHLREGVDKFSRRGKTTDEEWLDFAAHLNFMAADLDQPEVFKRSGQETNGPGQNLGGQGQPHLLPGPAAPDD